MELMPTFITSLFMFQVKAFCDVDMNKIQKGFYTYEESKVKIKPFKPVVTFPVNFTKAVTNSRMLFVCLSFCYNLSRKDLSQESQYCTTKTPPPPSSSVSNW